MFSQGVSGSSNMQQVQLAGIIGGLPLHGVEDQSVLARRRNEVLRQACVDALILVSGIPEALNNPLDALESRRLEQSVMKEPVKVVVSSHVVGTCTRFALSQMLAKVVQRLFAQVLNRMADSKGLEGLSHHEDLQQFSWIKRPHASAHVGLDDYQALAGKLAQGLSDRDSTRAALTGNSFLNNPLSRHQFAIENLLSQGACDARDRSESGRTTTQMCGGGRGQDWIQPCIRPQRLSRLRKPHASSTR